MSKPLLPHLRPGCGPFPLHLRRAGPQTGWVFEGCWSPFITGPCYDVYRDAAGAYWRPARPAAPPRSPAPRPAPRSAQTRRGTGARRRPRPLSPPEASAAPWRRGVAAAPKRPWDRRRPRRPWLERARSSGRHLALLESLRCWIGFNAPPSSAPRTGSAAPGSSVAPACPSRRSSRTSSPAPGWTTSSTGSPASPGSRRKRSSTTRRVASSSCEGALRSGPPQSPKGDV